MTVDHVADLVWRARMSREDEPAPAGTSERDRLLGLAAEFESMLLAQMLRDMRKAGSWDEQDDAQTLGAHTFSDLFDVELARHLVSVQGLGLARELFHAWADRFSTPEPVPRDWSTRPSVPESTPATKSLLDVPVALTVEAGLESIMRPTEPHGRVTSQFGWRLDPIDGKVRFHGGVDVRAAYGQDVPAAAAGRVVFSGDQGGYGTTVVIEHANGLQTRYAHLSVAFVAIGEHLPAGHIVGRAGQSGRATGPHLHFEVIDNGRRVDPASVAFDNR